VLGAAVEEIQNLRLARAMPHTPGASEHDMVAASSCPTSGPDASDKISEVAVGSSKGAGKMSRREDFLTLDEPIFNQFFTKNFSKELYMEQIHIPRQIGYSARFFESDFCESLTKTYWWTTPAVWFPVAAVLLWLSNKGPIEKAGIFVLGLFVWSLFEYLFHRFVFHCEEALPNNRYFLMLHFFTHAVHHYFPFDRLRLAMPPALLTILAIPTWALFSLFVPYAANLCLFAGLFVGFTLYDVMHFYLHHGAEKSNFSHIRSMRTYHAIHHYKEPHRGYGVTTKFWDRIFGTLIVPGMKKSS
jgi:4-hydroxysphinganine ceramide fatty acyl 2-hydroxylase